MTKYNLAAGPEVADVIPIMQENWEDDLAAWKE